MTTLNIFYNIKEAFETSTFNKNCFAQALKSIKWDAQFEADNEFYFVKGDMTITTPSLDPFNMDWEATAIFNDGSVLTIGA